MKQYLRRWECLQERGEASNPLATQEERVLVHILQREIRRQPQTQRPELPTLTSERHDTSRECDETRNKIRKTRFRICSISLSSFFFSASTTSTTRTEQASHHNDFFTFFGLEIQKINEQFVQSVCESIVNFLKDRRSDSHKLTKLDKRVRQARTRGSTEGAKTSTVCNSKA